MAAYLRARSFTPLLLPVLLALPGSHAAAHPSTPPEQPLESSQPTIMCTGVAKQDDLLLQAAIASLPAGSELKILGECEVSKTVVLAGGRSYVGGGRTTVIKQAAGANLGAVVASDSWVANAHTCGTPLRLSHIAINGNRDANTRGHGLVLHSWLSVIEDVEVSNAPQDGIRVTSVGSDNSTVITNSQVNSRLTNLFITDSGGGTPPSLPLSLSLSLSLSHHRLRRRRYPS